MNETADEVLVEQFVDTAILIMRMNWWGGIWRRCGR